SQGRATTDQLPLPNGQAATQGGSASCSASSACSCATSELTAGGISMQSASAQGSQTKKLSFPTLILRTGTSTERASTPATACIVSPARSCGSCKVAFSAAR